MCGGQFKTRSSWVCTETTFGIMIGITHLLFRMKNSQFTCLHVAFLIWLGLYSNSWCPCRRSYCSSSRLTLLTQLTLVSSVCPFKRAFYFFFARHPNLHLSFYIQTSKLHTAFYCIYVCACRWCTEAVLECAHDESVGCWHFTVRRRQEHLRTIMCNFAISAAELLRLRIGVEQERNSPTGKRNNKSHMANAECCHCIQGPATERVYQ